MEHFSTGHMYLEVPIEIFVCGDISHVIANAVLIFRKEIRDRSELFN